MSEEIEKYQHGASAGVAVGTLAISQGASVTELVQRARLIDECYKRIMKRDIHFGVIPGTYGKPSLLKAGAEKLLSLFNLGATEPIIKEKELPEGHREYLITINIIHYPTSRLVGTGLGLCSTMEKKYRYRNTADFEVLDEEIPGDARERKSEYRKEGYGMKKIEGEWAWVHYTDSEASENPDLADMFNTVLKMAHKRALVAGALVVTGASDIFTQDIEDFADIGKKEEKPEEKQGDTNTSSFKRKVTVQEGIEVWESSVKDVIEKPSKSGKPYFIVELDNGKSCFSWDQSISERLANAEGNVKIEVRPGTKPGSKVLNRIIEIKEPAPAE